MSSIPKIYVDNNVINDNIITITDNNYHHLKNVLRLKKGDKILVSNNNKTDYLCEIISSENYILASVIDTMVSETEFPFSVSLFQAFAKGDKMESIIQKSTEIGVTDIYLTLMDRCVSRPDDKNIQNKILRYQKIAENAASQSGRGIIPKIHGPITYDKALLFLKNMDISFVCYEGNDVIPIKNILKTSNNIESIGFIIGPEGGISDTECKKAMDSNISLVGLGKRILRTETASSFVLSVLSVFFS